MKIAAGMSFSKMFLRPLARRPGRVAARIVAAFVSAGAVGCGGGGGGDGGFDITDPIGSGLELALEGTFTGLDGLVVEFSGDEAVISDFGNSVFGTNPLVLPIGSPYIDGIACNESSCTGQIAVPREVDGALQGITREAATMTKAGDTIVVSSATLGEQTFVPGVPSDGDGGVHSPVLAHDAGCAKWWHALTGAAAWRKIYSSSFADDHGWQSVTTIRFFGDNHYELKWLTETGSEEAKTDVLTFDENFAGNGYCRLYLKDGGYDSNVLFPHGLADGELSFAYDPYAADGGSVILKFEAQ